MFEIFTDGHVFYDDCLALCSTENKNINWINRRGIGKNDRKTTAYLHHLAEILGIRTEENRSPEYKQNSSGIHK